MPPTVTKKDRIIFFHTLLLGTLLATIWLLKDYLSVIVLSLMFAIVVHPLYLFIRSKGKVRPGLATFVTMLISFFLIIMPIILSVNLFVQETRQLIADGLINTDSVVGVIEGYIKGINGYLETIPLVNIQINAGNIEAGLKGIGTNLSKYALDQAVAIGTSSVQFILNFFVFLILSFFAIPMLPDMKQYFLKISPLGDTIDELYIDRLVALVVTMIKSIFIIALAQGLLGALFMWIAGVQYLLTLTVMMIIGSLIPVVGTAFITVPVALYLLSQGDVSGAVIILFGQIVFVSNIDNILRAQLLSRGTSLHPAIMLMSIFGGLQVFGGLGLLFGPLVMILFLTSLQIYTEHYKY